MKISKWLRIDVELLVEDLEDAGFGRTELEDRSLEVIKILLDLDVHS